MQAAEDLPLRQAALALHALSVHDRGRVWDRLDADQRSLLEPLLAELLDLGIPAGRSWADGAAQVRQRDEETPPDLDKLARDVRRLRADDARRVLATQSLDTAACVLAWAPWPWRDAVLSTWPPESRHSLSQRVQERIQERGQGPSTSGRAVMTALLSSLLRDARALPPLSPAQPGARGNWFNRLFQR